MDERTAGWQKWILIGASVGGGFAAISALVCGGFMWYSSRPTPWKTNALTAVWSTATVTYTGNFNTMESEFGGYILRFGLQNNTASDITVPTTLTIMKRLSKASTLTDFSDVAKVDHSHFIPAHQTAEFSLELNWGCREWDESGVPHDRDPRTCFREAFEGCEGLVLFDPNQRLQIELPKPALK